LLIFIPVRSHRAANRSSIY